MGRTHQRANCQLDGELQGDDAEQRTLPSATAQNRVGLRHARSIKNERQDISCRSLIVYRFTCFVLENLMAISQEQMNFGNRLYSALQCNLVRF